MKTLKNILIIFLVIILTSGTCTRLVKSPEVGQMMYYEVDRNFTHQQLDSAFTAESLPFDLGNWHEMSSIVEGDSLLIRQWLFIENDSTFFILTDQDSIANFKKRVVRTK